MFNLLVLTLIVSNLVGLVMFLIEKKRTQSISKSTDSAFLYAGVVAMFGMAIVIALSQINPALLIP